MSFLSIQYPVAPVTAPQFIVIDVSVISDVNTFLTLAGSVIVLISSYLPLYILSWCDLIGCTLKVYSVPDESPSLTYEVVYESTVPTLTKVPGVLLDSWYISYIIAPLLLDQFKVIVLVVRELTFKFVTPDGFVAVKSHTSSLKILSPLNSL